MDSVISVKPISKKAKNRFANNMRSCEHCVIEQQTGDRLFLTSTANKDEHFWVNILNDENWLLNMQILQYVTGVGQVLTPMLQDWQALITTPMNPTLSYSEALDFAADCLVAEEFLAEYGSAVRWVNSTIDLGELFVFVNNCLAKI